MTVWPLVTRSLTAPLLTWRQAQAWRALAACTDDDDPGAWHASEPEPEPEPEWIAHAVRVCVACPVCRDCLTYALDAGETLVVWAASVEGDAPGCARSSGRHRSRRDLADGETTLDEVLDEHERDLGGPDDDPARSVFARAVRFGRRGGFGRDVLAHLWRTGRLPEPDEVDLPCVPVPSTPERDAQRRQRGHRSRWPGAVVWDVREPGRARPSSPPVVHRQGPPGTVRDRTRDRTGRIGDR